MKQTSPHTPRPAVDYLNPGHIPLALAIALALTLSACQTGASSTEPKSNQAKTGLTVSAKAETDPAIDDPDDPAIWLPSDNDPSKVRIITTDKGYGLLVYNLEGSQVQAIPSGRLNNVDVRGNLAFASNRTDTSISWYRIKSDGTLVEGSRRHPLLATVGSSTEIYGLCAYLSPESARLYVFVNFKNGLVIQFLVEDDGNTLSFNEVRRLKVQSQPEGMVADDRLSRLYLGEEDHGIWRFGAEPDSTDQAFLVDTVGSSQLGNDDVEGLAIYSSGNTSGFLIASSQGTHSYALYDRTGDNSPRGTFRIISGPNIDNVSETDGLEASSVGLGSLYPEGILVVQDDKNEGFTKNFKIVSWKDIPLPRISQ